METTKSENIEARTAQAVPAGQWDWEQEYAMHRHCQKTVCSAYGYQGGGATWGIIDALGLPNIQLCLSDTDTPNAWKDYFTRAENQENITQDLKSILELIDKVARQALKPSNFRLTFQDYAGTQYASLNIQPWVTNAYTVKIGHPIRLKIAGMNGYNSVTFNPICPMQTTETTVDIPTGVIDFHYEGEESTFGEIRVAAAADAAVEVPLNTLSLKVNECEVDSREIAMPGNQSLTVPVDYNIIQAGSWVTSGNYEGVSVSGNTWTITPNKNAHIYRISINPTSNITINLGVNYLNYKTMYFLGRSPSHRIVEFEVHIYNGSKTNSITIGNITDVNVSNSPVGLTYKTYLNDKNVIRPSGDAVFVFRVDFSVFRMCWSLAYIVGS